MILSILYFLFSNSMILGSILPRSSIRTTTGTKHFSIYIPPIVQSIQQDGQHAPWVGFLTTVDLQIRPHTVYSYNRIYTVEKRKGCFSLHNTVDVLLHPLGAGLFHLIGHVAVDVQRESCRGMAQVALYCLDVVTGTNGSNGVGMS